MLVGRNGIDLGSLDQLAGYGILVGTVSGSGTNLLASNPSGTVSGAFNFGNDLATVYSVGPANLGGSSVSGGVISAVNGVVVDSGRKLSGFGSVNGGIRLQAGVLEASSGNLVIHGEIRGNGLLMGSGSNGVSATGGLVADGNLVWNAPLTLAANSNATILSAGITQYSGSLSLTGGTLTASNGLRLMAGSSIVGHGTLNGRFLGDTGTELIVAGGSLGLGDSARLNGFTTLGDVIVGSGQLQLHSAAFATLGGLTQIGGGALTASNGIALSTGAVVSGFGTINGKVSGAVGSSIIASGGNLTVGKLVNSGFFHLGELDTQANTVTILNNTRSTLGSQTSLGSGGSDGTLIVSNGAFVDFGRTITGYGTVDSQNLVSKAMIINGDVIGNSLTERITFEGYVKGLGTFENVIMNGTFAPGLSPTLSNTTNLALGNNSILEMEIGGLSAGSQFDKIVDAGLLTLNGTLKLTLINGFNPTLGDSFDLFDWSTLAGSFSNFDFSAAGLAPGLTWDTSNLYTTGTLTLTAVPEPSALTMVGLSLLAMAVRRRRSSSASGVRLKASHHVRPGQ
ncbi:MAG: PEP-CTERM sorting domain-containing protein [Pirellulaceae bacterium]|nr:PEP-CTERM sorting domain-containing protein [Pirellulaceae bacterium]